MDDRLVELRDIMPTLLDMAGIPIPESVEGISLLSITRRKYLYGEHYEGDMATRMLRNQQYKLIYYPAGNCFQLFDLRADPHELHNLAHNPDYAPVLDELTGQLIDHLYGDDLTWLENDQLKGLPDRPYQPKPNRGLTAQRGWHFM